LTVARRDWQRLEFARSSPWRRRLAADASTPAEDDELRRLAGLGIALTDAARALGRNHKCVRERQTRLGIEWRPLQIWDKATDQSLRDMVASGASSARVFWSTSPDAVGCEEKSQ